MTAAEAGALRLLRRNVAGIYSAYAAAVVSGLVVTPILLDALGTEAYGVWSFIGAVTVFLALLDVGVAPSIIRFGAEYRGRGATDEINALASVGLAIYGAIGCVTVAIGVALAWLVPIAIAVPSDLVWPARIATLLVAAGLAARFPLGLATNLLLAQQRFDVVNLGSLISIVLYTAVAAAVLTKTGGLVLVAVLGLAATLVRLGFPVPWLRRELPGLQVGRSLVTAGRVRQLTSFSVDNFLFHLSGKVVFSADVIVVGVVLGAQAAGLYGIPAKLFALAAGMAIAATNLLLPALSELEGAGDQARQRRLFVTGLRAATALALVIGLPFVLIPDLLLQAWVGWEVDEPAWVLGLLGVALIMHQPVHVGAQYLIARRRQRALARALMATVTLNLVLSIVLAELVGLWGVAASTLATEAIAAAVVIPHLLGRGAGIPARALVRATLLPLPPALAIALILLVGFARAVELDTLVEIVPLGLVWVAAAGAAIWRFGFVAPEREALARHLVRRRHVPDAAWQVESG